MGIETGKRIRSQIAASEQQIIKNRAIFIKTTKSDLLSKLEDVYNIQQSDENKSKRILTISQNFENIIDIMYKHENPLLIKTFLVTKEAKQIVEIRSLLVKLSMSLSDQKEESSRDTGFIWNNLIHFLKTGNLLNKGIDYKAKKSVEVETFNLIQKLAEISEILIKMLVFFNKNEEYKNKILQKKELLKLETDNLYEKLNELEKYTENDILPESFQLLLESIELKFELKEFTPDLGIRR